MINHLFAVPPLQKAFEHYGLERESVRPLISPPNMALDELLNNVVQYAFPMIRRGITLRRKAKCMIIPSC